MRPSDGDIVIDGRKFPFETDTQGDTTYRTGEIVSVSMKALTDWIAGTLQVADPPHFLDGITIDRLALTITQKGSVKTPEYHFEASVRFALDGLPIRFDVVDFVSDARGFRVAVELSVMTRRGQEEMSMRGALEKSGGQWAVFAGWSAEDGVLLTDLADCFTVS
ncbi:hypothetical protein [Kitasatospora sp. NPDC089509]|uniref:hypothetical protein n=1 Tax=Kitasatospora sp. NPDC089509 TaxID=3364079 RepID=UPI00381269DF